MRVSPSSFLTLRVPGVAAPSPPPTPPRDSFSHLARRSSARRVYRSHAVVFLSSPPPQPPPPASSLPAAGSTTLHPPNSPTWWGHALLFLHHRLSLAHSLFGTFDLLNRKLVFCHSLLKALLRLLSALRRKCELLTLSLSPTPHLSPRPMSLSGHSLPPGTWRSHRECRWPLSRILLGCPGSSCPWAPGSTKAVTSHPSQNPSPPNP